MIDHPEQNSTPRSWLARTGIVLLNLLLPGLGLIRLGYYRVGGLFVGCHIILTIVVWLVLSIDMTVTFTRLLVGLGAVLLIGLVVYAAAIILSWRHSATVIHRQRWLWRWYGVLGLEVLVVAALWPFTGYSTLSLRNFYIPTVAMTPTLAVHDRIIADYRHVEPIARGDVVILRHGRDAWIKRVAAVPGDTIAMHDGVVILNGAPVAQRLVTKETVDDRDGQHMAMRLSEQFPGEAHPHEIYDMGPTDQDNAPAVTLSPSQYFLLGDNRDNSMDSRFGVADGGLGAVPRQLIEGRVLFRYWRKGVGLAEGKL